LREKFFMNQDSLDARIEAELRAQGLQRTIQDPSVVRRIASLLGVDDVNAREKRLAQVRRELALIEVRIRLGEDVDKSSPLDQK
jgi:hypothetical protein